MCPRPGTMLNITATMSLALPSAVCVAPRTQSQRSQRSASFGRRCPQYGHGILSPVVDSGGAAGASVYSSFMLTENHKPYRIRQANRIEQPPDCADYADYTDVGGRLYQASIYGFRFATLCNYRLFVTTSGADLLISI